MSHDDTEVWNTEIMENSTHGLDGQNTDNIEKIHVRAEVKIHKKNNIYHSADETNVL